MDYCGQVSKEESGLLSERFPGPSGLVFLRAANSTMYNIMHVIDPFEEHEEVAARTKDYFLNAMEDTMGKCYAARPGAGECC